MPSEIDPKLPAGLDDIFDRMTRDSQSERYRTIDEILEDFDKLQGLDSVLDNQTQVLVADSTNPIDELKFRPGDNPAEPGQEDDEDVMTSTGEGGSSSRRRPYSYQQRRKKS